MATPIVPADPLEVVFMASPETAPPTAGSLKRVVAASLIGTTIEWYDFFLYGSAAALVFNTLFFPSSDPLVGTAGLPHLCRRLRRAAARRDRLRALR